MTRVQIQGVTKKFGRQEVLRGIDLDVQEGERLVLLGPSGTGKTTLLRIIAGLEVPDRGAVLFDGEDVTRIPPRDRNLAFVFESLALWPHITAYENIAMGLEFRGLPQDEIQRRVQRVAEYLGIGAFLDRRPMQLSAGQMQRVALARALTREPRLFLFDEPMAHLDPPLRVQIQRELLKVHADTGATFIYVTHDQATASRLAHRVAVMHQGKIEQVGTADELYDHPKTWFVAGFIGPHLMNFFDVVIRQGEGGLVADSGQFRMPVPDRAIEYLWEWRDKEVVLGIRPEHIHHPAFLPKAVTTTSPLKRIRAQLDLKELLGDKQLYYCKGFKISKVRAHVQSLILGEGFEYYEMTEGDTFLALVDAAADDPVGETIELDVEIDQCKFFDPQTGRAIYS